MTRARWVVVALLGALAAAWLAVGAIGAQEKPAEPTLTELQQAKLENYALRDQTIQTQIALLQQARQTNLTERFAYMVQIEQEHPGWRLNRETVKWERIPAAKK